MIEAGRTGALTARAKTNVYLQETSGDLYVSSVYAETFIDLRSAGSMLDADNDDATTRAWNIYSPDAYLMAGAAAPSAPTAARWRRTSRAGCSTPMRARASTCTSRRAT